jgi:hypothetical protein
MPHQVETWMCNLKNLAKRTIVYPSPDQLLLRGSKLYIIQQLREIANEITLTDYPMVVHIPNPEDPSLAIRPGLIIKRSFSESAMHVWKASDAEKAAQVNILVENTRKFYDHDSLRKIGVRPRWFGIAYLPEMKEKGEIRVYFIGGTLSHMISTRPLDGEDLHIAQVSELTPLSHLSYVRS